MTASRIEIIERIERLKGNMSQEDFAKKVLECGQSKVSALLSLKGDKRISVEDLEKIADYFNVSVDSLLGREEKRRSGNITPRDFCRMLVDMVDFQGYSIHLKELSVKERGGYMCGDNITHQENEYKYLAVYFSEHHGNSDEFVIMNLNEDAPPIQKSYFESTAHEINKFLIHWDKIRTAYFSGAINREYYDILVNTKLSEIPEIVNEKISISDE